MAEPEPKEPEDAATDVPTGYPATEHIIRNAGYSQAVEISEGGKVRTIQGGMRDLGPHARLVALSTIIYQIPNENGNAFKADYIRLLKGVDGIYQRTVTIGRAWTKLDHGFIERAALVQLMNDNTRRGSLIPPREVQDALDKAILEVGVGGGTVTPFSTVAAGEVIRFCPPDLDAVRLRCVGDYDTLRAGIIVIPW